MLVSLSGPRMKPAATTITAISGAPRPNRPMHATARVPRRATPPPPPPPPPPRARGARATSAGGGAPQNADGEGASGRAHRVGANAAPPPCRPLSVDC